jgi:hypothetical protein
MLFKKGDQVKVLGVMGVPSTAEFKVIRLLDGERMNPNHANKLGLRVYVKGFGNTRLEKFEIELIKDCKHLKKGQRFKFDQRVIAKIF